MKPYLQDVHLEGYAKQTIINEKNNRKKQKQPARKKASIQQPISKKALIQLKLKKKKANSKFEGRAGILSTIPEEV